MLRPLSGLSPSGARRPRPGAPPPRETRGPLRPSWTLGASRVRRRPRVARGSGVRGGTRGPRAPRVASTSCPGASRGPPAARSTAPPSPARPLDADGPVPVLRRIWARSGEVAAGAGARTLSGRARRVPARDRLKDDAGRPGPFGHGGRDGPGAPEGEPSATPGDSRPSGPETEALRVGPGVEAKRQTGVRGGTSRPGPTPLEGSAVPSPPPPRQGPRDQGRRLGSGTVAARDPQEHPRKTRTPPPPRSLLVRSEGRRRGRPGVRRCHVCLHPAKRQKL